MKKLNSYDRDYGYKTVNVAFMNQIIHFFIRKDSRWQLMIKAENLSSNDLDNSRLMSHYGAISAEHTPYLNTLRNSMQPKRADKIKDALQRINSHEETTYQSLNKISIVKAKKSNHVSPIKLRKNVKRKSFIDSNNQDENFLNINRAQRDSNNYNDDSKID